MAFAVADDWQGRGVGTILLEQFTADARAAGVTRLRASLPRGAARSSLIRRVATVIETRSSGAELEVLAVPG